MMHEASLAPFVIITYTSLTIFMANPFSFSQAVFFKRETATSINQEARIFDFVGSLPRNNLSMRTSFLCTMHVHSVYYTQCSQ